MQDADATGELDPIGRISLHEDVDNDGVYEKHSVFVDKLVFPRFVLPFGAEQHPDDGVERRTRCGGTPIRTATASPTRRSSSPPISAAPATSSTSRAASTGAWTTGCTAPTTPSVCAGRRTACCGSRPAPTARSGASRRTTTARCGSRAARSGLPVVLPVPDPLRQLPRPRSAGARASRFRGAWPGVGDFQPGTSAIRRSELTLASVTGSAGNDIVRGHRMPKDLLGDYLYGEPVARIVRRVRPGRHRGADAAAERLPVGALRVHSLHGSPVPPRRHRDRA